MVEERYATILSTVGHITFIYTFFPSFFPTPYIHTRGNIMGGWTSLVEFGLASFFLTVAKFNCDLRL
jgi:hypothetical protein